MICKRKHLLQRRHEKLKVILLSVALISITLFAEGQQTPLNPGSYRVYSPFILNPGITGSKDFTAIDLAGVIQGDNKSYLLSANTRLSKLVTGYFNTPGTKAFTNIGLGGALFNDVIGTSRSIGALASVSYQLPVGSNNTSFVSFGATL